MKYLYYRWRLKLAVKHLDEVLNRLPDDWAFFPEEYTDVIADWAIAHRNVVIFRERLSR